MKYQKSIGIIFLFFFLIFILVFFSMNNLKVLSIIAESSDRPSCTFYWAIERIYKLEADKRNIGASILDKFIADEDQFLDSVYIRLLGVIGVEEASKVLQKFFIEKQNDKYYQSQFYHIIDSLGLIGNEDSVPFLEKLLNDYNKHNYKLLTQYSIAKSLFIITGRSYRYFNREGEYSQIAVTEELQSVRHIILQSRTRHRTFEEMIQLDKFLRPPE